MGFQLSKDSNRDHSILFVNPDYHCSFFLRDEFRKLGWNADIMKSSNYPEQLLWENSCIEEPNQSLGWGNFLNRAKFLYNIAKTYKYFLCYGSEDVTKTYLPFRGSGLLYRIFGSWELLYLKAHGCKIIFQPSGCKQEVLQEDFRRFQNGRVCANCGWADSVCNDTINARTFKFVNRYHSLALDASPIASQRIDKTTIRYKSLDLEVYSPAIKIPDRHLLPKNNAVRILHSFFNTNRAHGGKNIKGSPFVVEAIEQLKSEGHSVELVQASNVPPLEMRYLQLQADIIVEQLIYGWWGSTGVESMALGKPTVCFLWPEWKERFLKSFPEYDVLPIIEAGTDTIYDVLRELVENPDLRLKKGAEARAFAEQHFDVRRNAPELATLLKTL